MFLLAPTHRTRAGTRERESAKRERTWKTSQFLALLKHSQLRWWCFIRLLLTSEICYQCREDRGWLKGAATAIKMRIIWLQGLLVFTWQGKIRSLAGSQRSSPLSLPGYHVRRCSGGSTGKTRLQNQSGWASSSKEAKAQTLMALGNDRSGSIMKSSRKNTANCYSQTLRWVFLNLLHISNGRTHPE